MQIILLGIWRPLRRLEKSFKRDFKKRIANKGTLALVLLLLMVIPLLIIQNLKTLKKISQRSHITTTTKSTIMLGPVPSLRRTILKKTNSNLDNLRINNWDY